MKKLLGYAVISAVAMSMTLAACGSDDSSSNVERADDSSSSVGQSSSSGEESSSSQLDLPKGLRNATLDDLSKNLSLGEMFGTTVYMATGMKQGVFSLWIPDTAWIALRSEFKDGVLEVNRQVGSFMGAAVASADAMAEFLKKGHKFQFVVNEKGEKPQLQYSLDGGDYMDVENADVKVSSNWVSDGSKLQGLKLSCKNGDTTRVYSMYKGRYVTEESVDGQTNWWAGYYDVQRSHLLMLPVFYDKPVLSLVSAQISSSLDSLSMDVGGGFGCEKSDLKFNEISHEAIVGEWVADNDGLDWTLMLNKSGEYSLEAKKGVNTEELKKGQWDVYGDVLLVKNSSCMRPSECANAAKGVVEGFDKGKGFIFNHNDKDKPAVPDTWTVPQYE